MIIIGFAVWYLIGFYSFYYWWTKKDDITADPELIVAWLVVGLGGVLSWFMLMSFYNDSSTEDKKPIVLFKKRKEKK
tara:strand:+ start:512 stop:742 length:231 start_codon:yes stop_codon:yes gene_type:complete